MNAGETTAARCRSCDAPIVWAVSTSGRPMPLDAEPVVTPVGFVLVRDPDHPAAPVARKAEPVYRSHFASCPDADQHRTRRSA